MTPRLRALRWAAGAACALGVLLPAGSGHAVGAPPRSPGVMLPAAAASGALAAPVTPVTPVTREGDELAGSAAGVGRARPGRGFEEASPHPEAAAAARPVTGARPKPPARAEPVRPAPVRSAPARPEPAAPPATNLGGEQNSRIADLAAHIVPLGTGLALIGLGLGFLGMRLRR